MSAEDVCDLVLREMRARPVAERRDFLRDLMQHAGTAIAHYYGLQAAASCAYRLADSLSGLMAERSQTRTEEP